MNNKTINSYKELTVRMRGSRKDFTQFLRIAYSSGAELETQIEIAKQLSKIKILDYTQTDLFLNEIMRMLHFMIKKLNPNNPNEDSVANKTIN